jgi:hypothetical protein
MGTGWGATAADNPCTAALQQVTYKPKINTRAVLAHNTRSRNQAASTWLRPDAQDACTMCASSSTPKSATIPNSCSQHLPICTADCCSADDRTRLLLHAVQHAPPGCTVIHHITTAAHADGCSSAALTASAAAVCWPASPA